MSIRPVDLQVMVPRSTDVNKTGHENNPRPDLQSQNFSREFQRKVEVEQRQVNETFKPEQQTVDKDGRRKQEQEKKKKKNDGKSKQENTSNKSRYDISV